MIRLSVNIHYVDWQLVGTRMLGRVIVPHCVTVLGIGYRLGKLHPDNGWQSPYMGGGRALCVFLGSYSLWATEDS